MATGTSVARWVTLAAAVADTTASRYPICWANHRLDAPACSASRQTSSISAVDEKPSKNTPTAINHSLHWVATRTVAAESADIVTGPVGFRHAPLDAPRLQRTVHGRSTIHEMPPRDCDGYSATSPPTAARQRAIGTRG